MYIRDQENDSFFDEKYAYTDGRGMHRDEMRYQTVRATSWLAGSNDDDRNQPSNSVSIVVETYEQTKAACAFAITSAAEYRIYSYRLCIRNATYNPASGHCIVNCHKVAFGTFWATDHKEAKIILSNLLEDMRKKLEKNGHKVTWSDTVNSMWEKKLAG